MRVLRTRGRKLCKKNFKNDSFQICCTFSKNEKCRFKPIKYERPCVLCSTQCLYGVCFLTTLQNLGESLIYSEYYPVRCCKVAINGIKKEKAILILANVKKERGSDNDYHKSKRSPEKRTSFCIEKTFIFPCWKIRDLCRWL